MPRTLRSSPGSLTYVYEDSVLFSTGIMTAEGEICASIKHLNQNNNHCDKFGTRIEIILAIRLKTKINIFIKGLL